LGWVDPGRGWHCRWFGQFVDEAFWVCVIGAGKGLLAGGVDGVYLSVMDLIGCHQADAGGVVGLVVPGEERPAEGSGILDAAEAARELRLAFKA